MAHPQQPDADAPRDPGRDVAFAVFLAWAILVCSAFWILIALPARAQLVEAGEPARIEAFEAWLAHEEPAIAGRAVVVVDPPRGCTCEGSDAAQLAAFLQRAAAAGVTVIERAAAARGLPAQARIAVFAADGRLRYAGPVRTPMFCSGMATLADAALRDPSMTALVLPSICVCVATGSLQSPT